MANRYGFAFLESDHNLQGNAAATLSADHIVASDPISGRLPSSAHRSDLEKQHDVIKFLKKHRSSGCLQPGIIYDRLGVDLSEAGEDEAVRKMLLNNKLIKVEEEPDPENPSLTIFTFGYQAKFNNVQTICGLLAQINKSKYGIPKVDLLDSYEGVEQDIESFITGGEIIAIPNSEEKKNPILLQRGEPFYVELDGHVSILQTQTNNYNPFAVEIDVDPTKQVRRGEAVWVGGKI